MKTKKTVLTLILSAVLLTTSPAIIGGGIPVIDGANVGQNSITAFQEVASLLQQIQEYTTQLKQYKVQIKDNATDNPYFFSEVQNVLQNLENAKSELKEYKQVMKEMDAFLQDYQKADYYKTTPCYTGGFCTAEKAEEYKKNEEAIQHLKVLSNQGLFKTVENQIDAITADNKKLNQIKSSVPNAQGTTEAIQYLNQFAEMNNAQIIQLRALLTTQAEIAAQNQREEIATQAKHEAFIEYHRPKYKDYYK